MNRAISSSAFRIKDFTKGEEILFAYLLSKLADGVAAFFFGNILLHYG
jgi:hypothetical protein